MDMKQQLTNMTDAEAIALLSKNGNLIKRPFAIKGEKGVVGFNESAWAELFL